VAVTVVAAAEAVVVTVVVETAAVAAEAAAAAVSTEETTIKLSTENKFRSPAIAGLFYLLSLNSILSQLHK